MKKYLGIASITLKSQLVYRFDLIAGVGFSFIRVLLAFILWNTLFQHKHQIGGFSLPAMITYYIMVSFFQRLDTTDSMVWQFSGEIREGQFTKYLVKPIRPLWYFSVSCFTKTFFILGINLITTTLVALLFQKYFIIQFNTTAWFCGLLINLLGLSFLILLNYCIAILSFKFLEIGFFYMIKNTIMEFLIGVMIPLTLLPLWLQKGLQFLPFYYINYLPAMLIMGRETDKILQALLVLVIWNGLMLLAVSLFYDVLRKEYEGVGV